jgi:hypothetical protein
MLSGRAGRNLVNALEPPCLAPFPMKMRPGDAPATYLKSKISWYLSPSTRHKGKTTRMGRQQASEKQNREKIVKFGKFKCLGPQCQRSFSQIFFRDNAKITLFLRIL